MWTRTAFPVADQSDGGLTICSQLYSSLEVMTTLLVLMGWKGIYRIEYFLTLLCVYKLHVLISVYFGVEGSYF